ncbi:integrase core domain-containing protein, partial [Streptomyces sp. NPDC056352]|uniref:integrase core domain-containing protein n=1 Tax=Streptomyces sp. NPDC056352 TaxID=3345791 RepID=UPI0035DF3D2A
VNSTGASGARAEGLPATIKLLTWPDDLSAPATFKAELIEMQGPWTDVDQVERAIFQWITWYNEERLHSALDYVPPAEYEHDF